MISIITVAFNSSQTIAETIKSVLSQTYCDYEYLIIDGMSTDKTVDIIKMNEPLFSGKMKWISEKDLGLYDAMNKGIKLAKGEIIVLLNSDDLFVDSDVLRNIVFCFEQNKDADIVYADLDYVDRFNTSRVVRSWVTGPQRPFATGWHPAHPTFYVKRKCYEQYGLFDLSYKYSADFELMLRFVDRFNVRLIYLPLKLVRMRIGGYGNRTLKNRLKANIECIRAFRDNKIDVGYLYFLRRWWPKIVGLINK